jgi:hypothetical protein
LPASLREALQAGDAGVAITPASLFLDERTLKDRPRVKPGVIGAPEAPAAFIFFSDWQVKQ